MAILRKQPQPQQRQQHTIIQDSRTSLLFPVVFFISLKSLMRGLDELFVPKLD